MKPLSEKIRAIECVQKSTLFWAGLLLSIIIARNVLEGLLSPPHKLYSAFSILVHYPLWYLCLFFALAIFIALVSREKLAKTAKFVAVAWTAVLLVPVIDFIVSGGKGHAMRYILMEGSVLLESFFQMGAGIVTPGQMAVGIGAALLFAYYAFSKTGRVWRGLSAALGTYCIVFFFAAFPSIVLPLHGFGFPLEEAQVIASGRMLSSYYSFLLLFELALFGFLWKGRKFIAWVVQARFERAFLYISLVLLGAAVSGITSTLALLNCTAVAFLSFESALILNNVWDKEAGSGIGSRGWLLLAALLAALAAVFALLTSAVVLALFATAFAISLAYSMPNGLKKRTGFANNFVVSTIALLAVLAGYCSQFPASAFPLNYALLLFIALGLAFNAKDLKDVKRDMENGVKTLPVVLGMKKAVLVNALLVLAAYCLVPVLTNTLLVVSVAFGIASAAALLLTKNEKLLLVLFFAFILVAVTQLA